MPDIIERAEAELLKAADPFYTYHHLARLVPELVAELKSARAENAGLLADAEMWRGTQSMYRKMDKR